MKNNWLEIFIVTYNRVNKLKHTFEQLLSNSSPVKDNKIIVLDNNSTDGTSELIQEYTQKYPNIKHIKHNRNIGANANIARAYELASQKYIWILGDDDDYDFSDWKEVEDAVNNNQEIIMVSKYALHSQNPTISNRLGQATFMSSIILSTKLLDDTAMRNIYDNIYTMYVQLVPVIMALNEQKNIYVIQGKAIVTNGDDYNANNPNWYHSPIYHRGADTNKLYYRTATMAQAVGLANILELLNDNKIKEQCLENKIDTAVHYAHPFSKDFMHFSDLWVNFSKRQKLICIAKLLKIDKILWIEGKKYYIYIKILNTLKTKLPLFWRKS